MTPTQPQPQTLEELLITCAARAVVENWRVWHVIVFAVAFLAFFASQRALTNSAARVQMRVARAFVVPRMPGAPLTL